MSNPSSAHVSPNPSSTNFSQIRHVPTEITELPYDLEASKTISRGGKAVLQVIDAPYDRATPQVLRVFTLDDNIAEGMRNLPDHRRGTARILEVTVHSDLIITGLRDAKGPETTRPVRDDLINFLQNTYTQPFEERRIFRWLNDPVHVNDIGSISSQWSQELGGDNTHFYRLVNLIIVNDVSSKQTFRTSKSRGGDIPFQNPRTNSKILAGKSCTSLSDGPLETFAKLLVLDFFLASIYLQPVDHYAPIIYPQLPEKEVLKYSLTKNPHLQVPLGLFEPRLSAKSREAFKEIEDSYILRTTSRAVWLFTMGNSGLEGTLTSTAFPSLVVLCKPIFVAYESSDSTVLASVTAPARSFTISSSPSSGSSESPASSVSYIAGISATSSKVLNSSPTSSPSHGLSAGAKAGIGVGAALGTLALIALTIFVLHCCGYRRQATDNHQLDNTVVQGSSYQGYEKPEVVGQTEPQANVSQQPIYNANQQFRAEQPARNAHHVNELASIPVLRPTELEGLSVR
ncbi:hypothetical protein K432DRAFT_398051 [Lepidopterella palustris CBS 459.81]|uniref:Uncharacterized protein n=1 Tax=Lepidopterella palustris CBS 459.81 TaxID=1314670 RepID=A0A8E2J9P5_9PEZI|nr:hypothetical protein K432DRAFT_398051 [Lepidopterella palustris CBS 459.81]